MSTIINIGGGIRAAAPVVLAVGLLIGCGGEAVETAGPTPECVAVSENDVLALTTNLDTGERRIKGEVLSAVMVRSGEFLDGEEVLLVSVNVGGTLLRLAHAENNVYWESLDPSTAQITGLPEGPLMGRFAGSAAAIESERCAREEVEPSPTTLASGFDVEAWRAEAMARMGPETINADGTKNDHVELAKYLCSQGPVDPADLYGATTIPYEGSDRQWIDQTFCPFFSKP